jgi:hypothetical protein
MRAREHLVDCDLAGVVAALPVRRVPVDRVALDGAVELDDREALRPCAAAPLR